MNHNPVLAEVTRGGIVESFHRASYAVVDRSGDVLVEKGDIASPVYSRSASKALQALPLIESGAADAYGFTIEEIALACSSHNGEPFHVKTARSMLAKAGIDESSLQCGAIWPFFQPAARQLAVENGRPENIHNICSGKHAGMLATAKFLGEPLENYVDVTHPVQKRIGSLISQLCQCDTISAPCGIDGCSVPTWAIPLKNLALGFANLAGSQSGEQIFVAAKSAPQMIAGTNRYCTNIMKSIPRLFAKSGAEGVNCGVIPHAGIAIAVKCDDGAGRAAEVIFAKALAQLPVWTSEEQTLLQAFSQVNLKNSNNITVGQLRAC